MNAQRLRRIEWLMWSGLLVVVAGIVLAFLLAHLKLRMLLGKPLPVYGQVADFTLTNQNGRVVTLADLRGKVWVADIIFTRCPGPCLKMTRQMSELQAALPANAPVELVSLTADPAYDTPEVLKRYGERFGATPDRWQLLTGKKTDLY